jgi:hypothetical protein
VSTENDTAWLDALAGRTEPGRETTAAAPEVAEALALRELIRAQTAEIEIPSVPAVDLQREAQLLARARAAGLLPAGAQPASRRRWMHASLLAAAAVIVAAIGLTLFRPAVQPENVYRGAGTVHVQTRDPGALKQELTSEFTAAGAHVTGFERLGRPGIDVDLPQPVTPQIREILQQHHLPAPADGELTIEFEAAGQP